MHHCAKSTANDSPSASGTNAFRRTKKHIGETAVTL